MSIEPRPAAAPLFKFISPDGICWVFLVSDGNWEITRQGTEIARGPTDRASLDAGLKRFMSQRAQRVVEPGVAKRPDRPRDHEKEAAA